MQRTRESLKAWAIVLAHDGIGPGARRDTVEQTIEYAELAIAHSAQARIVLEALT